MKKKNVAILGALVGVGAVVAGLVVKTMRELNNKDMFADGLDDDFDFDYDLDDDDLCGCGCCHCCGDDDSCESEDTSTESVESDTEEKHVESDDSEVSE